MIGMGDVGIGAFNDSSDEEEQKNQIFERHKMRVMLMKRLHKRQDCKVLTQREQKIVASFF